MKTEFLPLQRITLHPDSARSKCEYSRAEIKDLTHAEGAEATALGSELTRQAFDTITPGGTGVITFDTTFAAGVGTGSIAEAGSFNDPTTGDMLNRVDFAAVNKTASDTLKVTCMITFTSS